VKNDQRTEIETEHFRENIEACTRERRESPRDHPGPDREPSFRVRSQHEPGGFAILPFFKFRISTITKILIRLVSIETEWSEKSIGLLSEFSETQRGFVTCLFPILDQSNAPRETREF
jgi:hypothetical protein